MSGSNYRDRLDRLLSQARHPSNYVDRGEHHHGSSWELLSSVLDSVTAPVSVTGENSSGMVGTIVDDIERAVFAMNNVATNNGAHIPGIEPVVKMDSPDGLYRGKCSCTWHGKGVHSQADARKQAFQHVKSKRHLQVVRDDTSTVG